MLIINKVKFKKYILYEKIFLTIKKYIENQFTFIYNIIFPFESYNFICYIYRNKSNYYKHNKTLH